MASSEPNEYNSQLSSCIDKCTSKKRLQEHEETIKGNQMAKKISNSSSDGKEQFVDMSDKELRSLLDEAMTYKSPKDANEKSETFRRLLQNVTEEDERKRRDESNSFNNWKAQSNSLQNLLDDSHYQIPIFQSHTSSKKNQRRKNSTQSSVSTRRLEGGSLPVDMHHSSAVQSQSDQPFLSELKNNMKRKEKLQNKETVIDMSDGDLDDPRKTFQRCMTFDSNKDTGSSTYDIEMQPYTNRVDMEVHDQSSSSKFTTANTMPNSIQTLMSTGCPIPTSSISKNASNSLHNHVDSYIQLPLEKTTSYHQAQSFQMMTTGGGVNPHNLQVLTPGNGSYANYGASSSASKMVDQSLPIPSGAALSSVIDPKSQSSKIKTGYRDDFHTSSTPTSIAANYPSTASSKELGKNKQKRKFDKNEKTYTTDDKSIEGFRGNDKIEDLLRYIGESSEGKSQKIHPKNGMVSTHHAKEHLMTAEEKKKKMVAKNKEKVNKLKKSNSMDELCSTGRKQQQEKEKSSAAENTANKLIEDITLRSKSSNYTSGAKKIDGKEKSQPKRNERRSWGNEVLWTTDSSANDIATNKENSNNNNNSQQDEQQMETETSSSSSSSGVQLDITSEPINISNVDSIGASNETDKFQVVMKKKPKVKRKSNEAPELKQSSTTSNLQTYIIRRDNSIRTGTKTYENSRNDTMKNSGKNSKPISQTDAKQTTNKNRRKSTSSMPPSEEEEGEYSDGGDSVQSLPIETTKTTSSLLSAPNPSAETSGKNKKNSNPIQISPSQQQPIQQPPVPQQQKPTTFSYADIAKTNTNRNNVNNTASTDKWPSISSSSSSHQTDPFAISNFDAINNTNSSNHNIVNPSNPHNISNNNNNLNNINSNNNNNNISSISVNQKQQKSTLSVSTSTMSFPDLVESNNNRNKQLSNSPLENVCSNGDATQTEKTLNGLDKVFDSNNNNSNSNTDDRINNNNNNNHKISYSQSLLENHNHQELDSNGNSAKTDLPVVSNNINSSSATGGAQKNVLTKSKSVEHNNLSSIEHYPALEKTKQPLSDVLSKPIESLSSKASKHSKQQVKAVEAPAATVVAVVKDDSANGKRAKKEKTLKKSTSVSTSTMTTSTTNQQHQAMQNANYNHRPPVIMDKSSDIELGLTFGFDIDENLLFGHHNNNNNTVNNNGDAVADIDSSVESNNNNNCDIMNTNLSSNTNLTNQSCGIEMYENCFASPIQNVNDHTQIIHPVIQSSSPKCLNDENTNPSTTATTILPPMILDTSNQSANDLGYMSSSLLTNNSATSPANLNSTTKLTNSENQPEKDVAHTPNELKQQLKFDERKIMEFISPKSTKLNFNYEELVIFVSEEWTKVKNCEVFKGQ